MIDPKVSIIHWFHCTQEKFNLQKMKERLQKQERFMRTKNKFHTGKEWRPYSKQYRWLVACCGQGGRQNFCSVQFLRFDNFSSRALLSFELMCGANNFVPIDTWSVLVIVSLFSQT